MRSENKKTTFAKNNLMRNYFLLVVLFLGLTQCKKSDDSANLNTSTQNNVQYAEGFSIEK